MVSKAVAEDTAQDLGLERYKTAISNSDRDELRKIQSEYGFLDREMTVMEYLFEHGDYCGIRIFFYRDNRE
jgi:hypothetical protein